MRRMRWDRERRADREVQGLELRLLSPLRGRPRLKPRSEDERVALALAARTAVEAGGAVEYLGGRRWRLLRPRGS